MRWFVGLGALVGLAAGDPLMVLAGAAAGAIAYGLYDLLDHFLDYWRC